MNVVWTAYLLQGLGFGFLVGLAPLIAGIRTGRKLLGNIGFCPSLTGGLIMGPYLSTPAALLFVVLIVTARPRSSQDDAYSDASSP